MIRKCLLALLLGSAMTASSQTLFTYGKYSASAQDFLRAFNKNNAVTEGDKAKAMNEYLELYINSRLKIQEAHARRYDTLAQIKNEVENLRAQIIENYMSDPEAISRLTKEAFLRSQKDVHVGHIFISFNTATGGVDSNLAKQKLKQVQDRLAKGEDFGKVAQELSDEPSAKITRGDMGFITVLTLPYVYENIVYNTAPGKISAPYTSRIGYHIFRNIEERRALGRIKIQQILLAFPPGADEATKKQIGQLADSLYNRINAGDDFSSLASKYSNDYISAATGGNVPEVSVGQYDPAFENMIWSLPKDGFVNKPYLSTHGYHIVKRISVKPVVTDPGDKTAFDELQQKIMADDRWKTAKDFIYDRVMKKPGLQKMNYTDAALWAYSDSLLDFKAGNPSARTINGQTALFRIGDTTIRASRWIAYAQAYRYKPDRSGYKPYPGLMDEFQKSAMYEYYRSHLEDYSDEFKTQMQEFRDGNLFFEIMQQEIWNRTQSDSAALRTLYNKNHTHYNWQPSAEAVIFFCSDAGTATTLYEQLKKDPAAWKKAVEPVAEKVVADSSRYEWAQIPGLDKSTPVAGQLTPQVVNSTDNTASFAYIIKVYPDPAPRSFQEAKGLVMNDYQTQLEEEWTRSLRKKYPVKVDKKVLASISK